MSEKMDSIVKLRLTYRAYAREHRAVEDQWNSLLDEVRSLPEIALLTTLVEGPESQYIRISEPELGKAKAKGILIAGQPYDAHLVVREWCLSLTLSEEWDNRAQVALWVITEHTGDVWTNIEIVREYFTDTPPQ